MFLGFANFYRYFIQGFSKITVSLTSILKTIELSKILVSITINANNNEVINNNDSLKPTLPKFKKRKLTKSKNIAKSKNCTKLFKF